MPEENRQKKEPSFVKKVWIVGLIFSLIATTLLIFEATFDMVILVLAGALIACYFRGLSELIQKKLDWNSTVSLAISVIGSFLIIGGIFFLIGATVSSQAEQMQESIPELLDKAEQKLHASAVGQEIIQQVRNIKTSDEFSTFISDFFETTLGGITNIYIVILIGIFFTVAPTIYVDGIIQLVPPKNRDKAGALMHRLGSGLKRWLAGKFIAMLAVFILTAVGLVILDIPMWLTLAVLAGLLNFIPNFGPLASALPALLVGLADGLNTALLIAGLYVVIQVFESSFITPKAQQRLIQIPPALIILAQVFVGALTGIWGIIFATPLVLIIIIIVEELYVKPMNKESEVEG
ncbi:Predicted PurR-regulated permease PerM [Salegentibacter echinorum]|uniref:Predicted PurR-regulated permease PerM n=1 Tax=Salegentibacter echinorum TaxID=1073325 RepID=A0A1M5E355_SALEC|nr:AI-2E family transporter [Salegentibacter echinorum]SHF73615.1 Predicted PurR-regulated permease PerM [Salegentibacter echinorum]